MFQRSSSPRADVAAEPWVSVDAVATHLGVGKISIYRWIERRGLPATKVGKLWKLKLSEVDAWMLARGEQQASLRSNSDSPGCAPSQPEGRADRPARSVLLIDDDVMVRDTLEEFLTDEGYQPLLAEDGERAMELLAASAQTPVLIVLDLKMPNLDGWRFREAQLREPRLASIPVIVVTAVSEPNIDGVTILRKPLKVEQLARAMSALSDRSEIEGLA